MNKNQMKLYKSKDLAECAALVVKKQRLIRIEREGRVCWFIFDNSDNKCQELSNQFFFGELNVNAREYHDAMGRLKNRIFTP